MFASGGASALGNTAPSRRWNLSSASRKSSQAPPQSLAEGQHSQSVAVGLQPAGKFGRLASGAGSSAASSASASATLVVRGGVSIGWLTSATGSSGGGGGGLSPGASTSL